MKRVRGRHRVCCWAVRACAATAASAFVRTHFLVRAFFLFRCVHCMRAVVGPFDAQFNAITGLNGSGKSNILDAICFVLGISNLSQVRVASLQELIYKQGQAGVTKASVTIVFNNEVRRT